MSSNKKSVVQLYVRAAEVIISTHENPNDWNKAVRRLVEHMGRGDRLGRIGFYPELDNTLLSFLEEMAKLGETVETIERALQECFGPFTF